MRRRSPPQRAVVFDLDGTLVSTQGIWDRAYAALFARYGRTLNRADRHRLVGLPLKRLGRAIAELLDQPGRHTQLSHEMYNLVAGNLAEPIQPLPGAVELVTALHATRPVAVATNTPRIVAAAHLDSIGLADVFDVVIGCDDVVNPKPAPDPYLTACTRLGIAAKDTVAIEDSPIGVASARAAGLFAIGVPSTSDLILPADLTSPSLASPHLWRALQVTPLRQAAQPLMEVHWI